MNQPKSVNGSFRDYVSNIDFRYIQPRMPIPPYLFHHRLQRLKLNVLFEIFNTLLPHRGKKANHHQLRELCRVPKMSTYAIGAIINEAVQRMPSDHVFLNIGVWHGYSLLAGMVGNQDKICIGVDNFSEFGGPHQAFWRRFKRYRGSRHRFYEADYVDYFSREHDAPIGFYIYDAGHSYEDQLRALQLAEPFFADDCVILIDDTNYDEVRQATVDFIAHSSHEYRVIFDQMTYANHHPTFWNGVMILRRILDSQAGSVAS